MSVVGVAMSTPLAAPLRREPVDVVSGLAAVLPEHLALLGLIRGVQRAEIRVHRHLRIHHEVSIGR
jgi:hypothetical protein